MRQWLDANVTVDGRPEWLFVKLHTHGCKAGNIDCLLGEETAAFHQGLQQYAVEDSGFRLHYVTAWEMAQLVHQAEQGRDHVDLDALRAGSSGRRLVAEGVGADRL
jgi:hypothetical protein